MSASFGHALPPMSAGGAACHSGAGGRIAWDQHVTLRRRALVGGALAGLALVAVYIAVLGFANSLQHVASEFLRLWFWIVPLLLGFVAQIALFAYARGATKGRGGLPASGVVGSGVANTVSMLAQIDLSKAFALDAGGKTYNQPKPDHSLATTQTGSSRSRSVRLRAAFR